MMKCQRCAADISLLPYFLIQHSLIGVRYSAFLPAQRPRASLQVVGPQRAVQVGPALDGPGLVFTQLHIVMALLERVPQLGLHRAERKRLCFPVLTRLESVIVMMNPAL